MSALILPFRGIVASGSVAQVVQDGATKVERLTPMQRHCQEIEQLLRKLDSFSSILPVNLQSPEDPASDDGEVVDINAAFRVPDYEGTGTCEDDETLTSTNTLGSSQEGKPTVKEDYNELDFNTATLPAITSWTDIDERLIPLITTKSSFQEELISTATGEEVRDHITAFETTPRGRNETLAEGTCDLTDLISDACCDPQRDALDQE